MSTDHSTTVAVVGAGPAGAMMALTLARRGYAVDVYEKRPDFRVQDRLDEALAAAAAASAASASASASSAAFGQSRDSIKRSINLALSHRGQEALRSVGLLEAVMEGSVPMPCRALHLLAPASARASSSTSSSSSTAAVAAMTIVAQPYGRAGQAIYSVSRALVNSALLDALDAMAPRVRLHFGALVLRLEDSGAGGAVALSVRLADGNERTYEPRLIVGADGAFSAVRGAMLRFSRTDFARRFIEHGYKELAIPASAAGDFALPTPHALHIWPRHSFMLIALPNPDRSFTATLFAPFATFDALEGRPAPGAAEGEGGGAEAAAAFAAGSGGVRAFFARHFPDALPLLPELERQFAEHPTSSLVEVRCRPYNVRDRVLLVGDAAHSTVPFYGQGMNAALEDSVCLAEALDAEGGDLARAVPRFARERQPAGEALCDLSMGNYGEMRDSTASRWFLARKELEAWLHWLAPTAWVPQYSMVAFTRIPYHEVVRRARRQDTALDAALAALAAVTTVAAAAAFAAMWRARGRASR